MKIIIPEFWKAYELLDSGNGKKLERFGEYVLSRPEPQAVWSPFWTEKEWAKRWDAEFVQEGSHTGSWNRKGNIPDRWSISYQHGGLSLSFQLALTGFKHVGIFPEQADNWEYIFRTVKKMPEAKVLNLFAYTGGASLAANAAGADVIHCDSIRQVVTWANQNRLLSHQKDIRWLIEDAFTFVKREAKRGSRYQGIILDPPAWGNGPKGEKWKLEDMVNELIALIAQILDPQKGFLVFNAYSLGFSPVVLQNLIFSHFGKEIAQQTEIGELCFKEKSERLLPMGIVARFSRG